MYPTMQASTRMSHERSNMPTTDWCIAQVAKKLGRTEDAERLEKASQNYKNLFDPETKLMRGRNADGTFQSPFSPYKWGRRIYGG